MKELTVQERYAWFVESLKDMGIHLLDLSDDLIGFYVFEEFDADSRSCLCETSLSILLNEQLISPEIYEQALELSRQYRELENSPLSSVEAVKTAPRWRELMLLSDRIKEQLNLSDEYRLNEEYRYLNPIALEIAPDTAFRVQIKTWNEIIRLESDGYVFLCRGGEKHLCEEEPILYRIPDWIAFLETVLNADPLPREKWGKVGETDYANCLLDEIPDNAFPFVFMGKGNGNVYLYPKDGGRFGIEITEGTPFLEEPTPYRLLWETEVDRTMLEEWIETLKPYAPVWTE